MKHFKNMSVEELEIRRAEFQSTLLYESETLTYTDIEFKQNCIKKINRRIKHLKK